MIDQLIAKLEVFKNQREYKKNFELSRKIALFSELFYQDNKKGYKITKHPLHDDRVNSYSLQIKQMLPKGRDLHLNFGDSLTDLSRQYLKSVDGIFSVSGSWSCHIRDMIEALKDPLKENEIKVGKVSLGCLGGNPMLVYQNYDEVVLDAIKTLNYARGIFPEQKIVVYGLPPVFNLYVTENTYQFDSELQKWCERNSGMFISLKEHFGKGFGRLFPDTKYSSDGVHFNPEGAIQFNALLRIA